MGIMCTAKHSNLDSRTVHDIVPGAKQPTQMQNCDIDYDDYKDGHCLWGYDFTPDQGAAHGHLQPMKTDSLKTRTSVR